jgi:bisanhydrobacterioruberin hydratase
MLKFAMMQQQIKSIINSHYFSIFLLLAVYCVGLAGFLQFFHYENFELLTPYNLLFSLVIVLWKHPQHHFISTIFFTIIFACGYWVEWLGVNTQMIFGTYWYGKTLGIKVLDIPLMIGINWVMLVYITACIADYLPLKNIYKAVIAALLMVALDILIEPFAIKYDLWQWMGNIIPIQNYVAWFIIGFLMQFAFFQLAIHKKNITAVALYLIQVLFFGILLLV